MFIRPPTERPKKFALTLGDGVLIDAGNAAAHQAVGIEFPVLVAVGAVPVAAVIPVFVSKADRDAVAAMRPELLDQPVIQFASPFAAQESLD